MVQSIAGELSPRHAERVPAPTGTLSLARGRLLAYEEFGALDGYPLLYFHDSGSSRLECGFFDAAARRRGFRLIAIDRPGIGHSDYYLVRRPADVCEDAVELADRLRLDRFGLMSLGAGGLFGLTLAHGRPERVSAQLSLGGVPGGAFSETGGSSRLTGCWNGMAPAAVRILARVRYAMAGNDPRRVTARLAGRLAGVDRKILENPSVFRLLALDQRAALRQGTRGLTQDLAACFRKLDFRLQDVAAPMTVWRGQADRLSQRSDCEYLVSRLPMARFRRVPNQGRLFFVRDMDPVFIRLREDLKAWPRAA